MVTRPPSPRYFAAVQMAVTTPGDVDRQLPLQRGQDVEAEIALTLEEADRGSMRSITFHTLGPCMDCGGSGSKDGKNCPTCHAARTIRLPKSFDVTIPAGLRDGSVIRLAGQGEPGMSGGPAVTQAGKVAGINVAKRLDGELVSFLVPASKAAALLARAKTEAPSSSAAW